MKKLILLLSAAFAVSPMALMADIVVPGADGQDCELTITQNTVIDLSLATTATWNASYNSLAAADPNRVVDDFIGKGVYDPEKWAVVFRYTDVSIAAGATVTFKNHPSRAPVVWLVSGNVDIAGTVSLNGGNYVMGPAMSEPGPGGFRGGVGSHYKFLPTRTFFAGGAGRGPGGGPQLVGGGEGFGASYSTKGEGDPSNGTLYGNPSLVPLIGGSGGAADTRARNPSFGGGDSFGGGAGGGAILIAATSQIQINGIIRANGGEGTSVRYHERTGSGSGGGIRLCCRDLVGTGQVQTMGGIGTGWGDGGWDGGQGRIRLERQLNVNALTVTPGASSQLLTEGESVILWPSTEAPTAKLVSFGGINPPSDPRAEYDGNQGPDLIAGTVPTTQAVVETINLPQTGQVQVRIAPQHDAEFTLLDAVFDSQVSEDPLVLRWVADVPIANGYSAIQIRIVAP